MSEQAIQLAVFCAVLGAIAVLTYIKCKSEISRSTNSNKEYFLAGGGLTWVFVAGSITLTNLSTDQLVGMNGNQMLLLALWELSGFMGLMILAKVFLPRDPPNTSSRSVRLNGPLARISYLDKLAHPGPP